MFCVLLWVIVHAWLALSRDVAQSKALRLCATAHVDSKIPSYRDVVGGLKLTWYPLDSYLSMAPSHSGLAREPILPSARVTRCDPLGTATRRAAAEWLRFSSWRITRWVVVIVSSSRLLMRLIHLLSSMS